MLNNDFRFTCSKRFDGFPCTHRQWRHSGHCRYVHGYSRSFHFWFAAKDLDKCGFVVDFSSLKPLEEKLRNQFDHTFLSNADDPLLPDWKRLHSKGAIDLRIMDNVGMEYSSKLIWEWSNSLLLERDAGRTCVWRTESLENNSNAAMYEKVPEWFL